TAGDEVFESTDGGLTWRVESKGLGIMELAVTPRVMYAGTRGSGVDKSTYAGRSWSLINNGLRAKDVDSVAVDPRRPATAYVVMSSDSAYVTGNGGAVFKTIDGGTTWRAITGIPSAVQSLAIDPHAQSTMLAGG